MNKRKWGRNSCGVSAKDELLEFLFLRDIVQIDGQNLADTLFLHNVLASCGSLATAFGDFSFPPLLVLFPPKPLRWVSAGALWGVTMLT